MRTPRGIYTRVDLKLEIFHLAPFLNESCIFLYIYCIILSPTDQCSKMVFSKTHTYMKICGSVLDIHQVKSYQNPQVCDFHNCILGIMQKKKANKQMPVFSKNQMFLCFKTSVSLAYFKNSPGLAASSHILTLQCSTGGV